MAFATQFLFKFVSAHGVETEIRIQKDGYSGAVIQRALGRPPILKRGQNGPICGTSLELYAECLVNGEFASLYTSNPKEYKAQLLRGNTVIWEGFVSTELYSEPGIAPPYDVQIIATDGLGELKLVNYEAHGEISLSALFVYLLSFTGIDRDIYFAWKIKDNDGTIPGLLDGGLIDLDYMAGETCYDVLTYVLDSFHATISAHKDDWVIMRETDLSASETRLAAYRIPAGGGSATLTYFSYINKSVGQMGVADLWPVGNYSTKIEPARKSVTLYAPWHVNNILRNPNLIYAQGGWTLSEYANWVSSPNSEILIGPLGQWAYVLQSFNLQSLQSEIDVSAMIAMLFRADIPSTWFVYATYQTEDGTFYGDADGWVDEQPRGVRVSHDLGFKQYVTRHYEKYEETIPNPFFTDPGVLTIVIGGRVIALGGPVYMTLAPANKGYKDVIHIDNDARGDGAEVEVLHGRIMAEEFTYPDLLSGALKKIVSGVRTYIYKFADADNSNVDFLALTALSYAKSVGLPRLRREGVLDMPSTLDAVPFFLTMESVRHIVETYEWDLYNEEAKISVLSIPSVSIAVESEIVAPLDDSYTGVGSSSGGPGGGGGGGSSFDLSGYVQVTRLAADEAIIAEAIQSFQSQIDAVSARDMFDELTATVVSSDVLTATEAYMGYAHASRYYLTDSIYFWAESVNGAMCVRLNAPLITAGDQIVISGTPGGGGGGGGITLYDYDQVKAMTADVALTAPSAWAMHQMWAEIFGGASSVLTSGNYTNYVNTTNFPGLDKVGTVTSVATGTGLTGGPITASGTISIDPTYLSYISHGETAYGWGDILTQALQSLQSQVDSVSARNNYDELTATAIFGDVVSASALYAGRIELAGEDLGTAVTGIRSRLSSVESKFDADGSALSAVKLKTSRTIWGQSFDGTANVSGDLNLNGSSILGTLGNPVLSMAGMNGNYWVALGSMFSETRTYNPMLVGHAYISGSSATPSSVPSETLFVNGTSAFDGNVEIKTGRTLTIGGAVFTWVPAEGDTPGYLRLSTAFVTEGDQIILSGEPGGGGQGVGYLYELEDVSDELATPTTGMVLYYDGTEWIGVAATEIGGVTSVVGASGDVTVTQIIDAIAEEGLPWSVITEKPTTLAGYGITDAATASSVAALTTRVGTLESDETIISLALQSLQSQVDSVSARNEFDELTATVLFADTLSVTSAYIGNITGHLSGNADTASHLIGSSYAVGSATQPVYFSGGLPVSCTYSINAATTSGTAGRLAYYAGANAISDFYNTIGGAYQPMYLNAGVPTACTYTLNAALYASSVAGRLAYYSGTNLVSEYYNTIGSGVIPMYLNAGVPTASTSTVGSASLPVYLNAGTITACTAASLFSALGSNTVNNLEVTVAGQLRTITNLYATYDGAGENISDKFTIVSSAIQSLQSQIDSVATRFGTDECIATTAYFDMLSVGAYIYAGALVTTGDQTVASDATLKTNWRGLNYGIEDIARATAGVFDWKDGHGTSAGTIAQEWKALIPELVHGEEGGMSLAYGQAAMLNTILLARHETEQDREIRQLKARVDELETRLKIRS